MLLRQLLNQALAPKIVAFNKKHISLACIDSLSLQKMSRMKSKDSLKKAVYEFLDWLEVKQPQLIGTFWRAAFVELLMNHYPTLRRLHSSLMGGQCLNSAHNETHILQDGIVGSRPGVGPKLVFHGRIVTLAAPTQDESGDGSRKI